jgi:hypothetical protein
LKLPLLLAEFLYQHKKLSLPGLGIFTLDPAIVIPADGDKGADEFVPAVEFENAVITRADDDLVEFIKKNTGKMKPLAIADLDSYATLATQMINIGKPFYIEGIGTLSKGKEKRFDFTPGQHDVTGVQDPGITPGRTASKNKGASEKGIYDQSSGNGGRKFVLALAVIAAIAAIAWGSYKLYEKNKSAETSESAPPESGADTAAVVVADSQQVTKPLTDTVAPDKTVVKPNRTVGTGDSLSFKFVILKTNNKSKAIKRYNQLLSYLLKIKMQTKDSSFFKLYFTFPAMAKDTIHIKDSLNTVYATHTLIETILNN